MKVSEINNVSWKSHIASIFHRLTGLYITSYDYGYYYTSLRETFMQGQYKWLAARAKGKFVINLGAQTGDCAIYLLQHGARHIIAYEPDSKSFALLKKNIEDKQITILCQKAPQPFKPTIRNSYVIKSDIEGAEHQVFTEEADLSGCTALQIEYHYGPQSIPKFLRAKGFRVKVAKPYVYTMGDVGWIYAEMVKK